jgi:hypothetical protein
MFGGGIYFADSEYAARKKALHAPSYDCVVITAKVWLGFMLEVPSAMSDLTKHEVYDYGCHSIHGKTRRTGDEYVTFDQHNIIAFIRFDGLPSDPFVLDTSDDTTCHYANTQTQTD